MEFSFTHGAYFLPLAELPGWIRCGMSVRWASPRGRTDPAPFPRLTGFYGDFLAQNLLY